MTQKTLLLEERRKFMISWCNALLAQGMKV